MKGILSTVLSICGICFWFCGLVLALPPACSQLSVFTSDYIVPLSKEFFSQPGNMIGLKLVSPIASIGMAISFFASLRR
jgi:hypothetical protein